MMKKLLLAALLLTACSGKGIVIHPQFKQGVGFCGYEYSAVACVGGSALHTPKSNMLCINKGYEKNVKTRELEKLTDSICKQEEK